ncbi:MAG TPA: sterol desaturase family protein [Pyrinomonadaceae bacterium]
MSIKGWKKLTPFYFYTGVVAFLLAAAGRGNGPTKSMILILVLLGLLSWGLVEYILHRFIFHLDAISVFGHSYGYSSHLTHHENPKATDDLFASLKISVPIAATYWMLAWIAVGTWRAASYLFIGLVVGYFCYEWLHFVAHHGKSRLPLFRYLRKYHLLHHYRTPDRRFGVTSPIFDLIFGTFRPVRLRQK